MICSVGAVLSHARELLIASVAPSGALENVPDSVPEVVTRVATSPELRATHEPVLLLLLRPWPRTSFPPSVMFALALSWEKSVPGVDPLLSMNDLVVVEEPSVAAPATASVVAPLLFGLVPSSSKLLPVMLNGPDVEPGLATSEPPLTVTGSPLPPLIEPG